MATQPNAPYFRSARRKTKLLKKQRAPHEFAHRRLYPPTAGREAVRDNVEVPDNNSAPATSTSGFESLMLLIEECRQASTGEKRTELFKKIMEAILDEYGNHPPYPVHIAVISIFSHEKSNGDDCMKLGYYYESIEKHIDAIKWYKRSFDHDKNYKALHNLATAYSYLNRYDESLDTFHQCLKLDIANEVHRNRITYNYGFTLFLVGNYKKANAVFNDLTRLFDKIGQEDRGAEYWVDCGDHYLYNLYQPFEAVAKYEEGLQLKDLDESNRVKLLLGLVNASNKCIALVAYKEPHEIVDWKRKAKVYFQTAYALIKESGRPSHGKLGELYFYNRNIEEARQSFEALSKLNISTVGEEKGDVSHFLGLCNLYLEKYEEALRYFNESIHINHPTFTSTHLAECYLKLQKFKESEDALDRVLNKAPYNTNSLICQVFLYRDWAENLKTTNAEKAVDLLEKSIQTAAHLLEHKDDPKYLRKLTHNEIFELRHTISYCQVEKYNHIRSKTARISALQQARLHLKELGKSNNNAYYFRANRTLHDVERIIDDYNRSSLGRKLPLMWMGGIAAIIALFMIFVGKPVLDKGYQLDTSLLAAQLKVPQATMDSVFRNKRFTDVPAMNRYVRTIYAERVTSQKNLAIEPLNNYYNWKAETVDTGIIVLILSISVCFLVLGLLSNELKILKVGVIHIEKGDTTTMMDQIELKMIR